MAQRILTPLIPPAVLTSLGFKRCERRQLKMQHSFLALFFFLKEGGSKVEIVLLSETVELQVSKASKKRKLLKLLMFFKRVTLSDVK